MTRVRHPMIGVGLENVFDVPGGLSSAAWCAGESGPVVTAKSWGFKKLRVELGR